MTTLPADRIIRLSQGVLLMKRFKLKAILVALVCTLISAGVFAATPEEARKAFDQGKVDDAIAMSKEALATKPDMPTEAKYLDVLTRAYMQKEDWTNAYEFCGRMIKWDLRNRQQNVEHRYMTSLILYKLGKTAADSPERNVAVSGVILALESDPKNPQYLDLADKIGINKPGVKIKVETVAGGTPPAPAQANQKSDAEILTDRAADAFEKGKDTDAMFFVDKAIRLDPNLARAWGVRASIYLALKDYRSAVNDFTKALEIGPRDAFLLYGRAMTKREMHLTSAAMSDINQAIALDPKSFLFVELRALLRSEAGDLKGALEDFSTEVKLAPKYYGAWFNRAVHYIKMKEFALALVDAMGALNLDPQNPDANGLVGECYLELGNKEKAIQWYKKAVDLGDEQSKSLLTKLLNEQK